MKSISKAATSIGAATFFFTLFACGGATSSTGGVVHIRTVNFSRAAAVDASLFDAELNDTVLASDLAKDGATCPSMLSISSLSDPQLRVYDDTGTVSYLSKTISLTFNEEVDQAVLLFGPTTNMNAMVVNSGELDTDLKLFICDLSTTDNTNYQVFVKDLGTNVSTQITPIAGVDGQRMVGWPIDTAGSYQVDLVLSGVSVASAQVTIDASHKENIIGFVDQVGGGGLTAKVMHADEGCVAR